jgi:hypothetical protein
MVMAKYGANLNPPARCVTAFSSCMITSQSTRPASVYQVDAVLDIAGAPTFFRLAQRAID